MNQAAENSLRRLHRSSPGAVYALACQGSLLTLIKWLLISLVPIALLFSEPDPAVSRTLPDVYKLFHQSKERGGYVPPSPEELDIVENLFARLLKGERGDELAKEWKKLGYHLNQATLNETVVLALSEDQKVRKGRGFYLFPLAPVGSSLLMIPHRFYDMHTGPIGLKLFAAGSFSGASFNTVHRHKKSKAENGFHRDNDSLPNWDLADLTGSYFTALTRAFNRTFPQGHLIQVHGFSKEKRTSWAGRDSDIILSNGTEHPPAGLIEFADCLKLKMGVMVRVYPHEVRDLGAMENVSARITDDFGNRGFVQMEMSLPIREDLLKSMELNKVITHCMQESWQ